MERRKEIRLASEAPVTVTLLEPGPAAMVLQGRFVDIAGSGARIAIETALPCGSAVQIQSEDALLLGEVCRVDAGESGWMIAVKISHSLGSLAELNRLNQAILGTESKAVRGAEVSEPADPPKR